MFIDVFLVGDVNVDLEHSKNALDVVGTSKSQSSSVLYVLHEVKCNSSKDTLMIIPMTPMNILLRTLGVALLVLELVFSLWNQEKNSLMVLLKLKRGNLKIL